MRLTFFFNGRDRLERTLDRLRKFGFRDGDVEVKEGARPRLSLKVPMPELLGVVALVGAIDAGDPEGRPGLWDTPPKPGAAASNAPPPDDAVVAAPSRFPIAWNPIDRSA